MGGARTVYPKMEILPKKVHLTIVLKKWEAELVYGQLSASAVPTTSVVSWVSCAVRNIAVMRL